MKKVLLFAAFAAFAMTNVNAQDEDSSGLSKSDIYMTGTVGFNSSTDTNTTAGVATESDESGTVFSPTIGYMVSDNIALEAGLSYSSSDDATEKTDGTEFQIGARWFMNPGDKFSLSVGVGLGFGTETTTTVGSTYESETSGLAFAIAPAINYWMSDSWGLFAEIAAFEYSSEEDSNNDNSNTDETTSTGLNVDLSNINFGLVYKF